MRFQASIQIEQQDSTSNTKKKATLISHISWTRLGTLNLLKPARAGQTVVFNSIFQLRQRYIVWFLKVIYQTRYRSLWCRACRGSSHDVEVVHHTAILRNLHHPQIQLATKASPCHTVLRVTQMQEALLFQPANSFRHQHQFTQHAIRPRRPHNKRCPRVSLTVPKGKKNKKKQKLWVHRKRVLSRYIAMSQDASCHCRTTHTDHVRHSPCHVSSGMFEHRVANDVLPAL